MPIFLVLGAFVSLIILEWIIPWIAFAPADFTRNIVLTSISLANVPLVATGVTAAFLYSSAKQRGQTLLLLASVSAGLLWSACAAVIIPFAIPWGWRGVVGPNVGLFLIWTVITALLVLGRKHVARDEADVQVATEHAADVFDGVSRTRRLLATAGLDHAMALRIRNVLGRSEGLPRMKLNGEIGRSLVHNLGLLESALQAPEDTSLLSTALTSFETSLNTIR